MASLALRLLPFTVTSIIYIVHWIPKYGGTSRVAQHDSYQTVTAKCLPILCLCGFVLSYRRNHPNKQYLHLILAGLVFSGFGDAFLVFNETHFIHGLLSFAVGHVMYTVAMGFKKLKLQLLIIIIPMSIATYFYLIPWVEEETMKFCGCIYGVLICTMVWRAMARSNPGSLSWQEVCGCAGAISFYLSDFVLCVNKFRYPVPQGYFIIMSTYYLAQLGISLSVVPVIVNTRKKKLY